MLSIKRRQHFKRWKLYEKESFFWVTICYEIENVIKLQRFFRPDERKELNDMILDLYFDYEYTWQPMTARQIAEIYGCDHTTVDRILEWAKQKIRDRKEQLIESWIQKSTISKNLNILL